MRHRSTVYVDGYDHYDKKRTIKFQLLLNEAEQNFLEDLFNVLNIKNKSAFIRNQVFHAYENLTEEQKKAMKEVAQWRLENDQKHTPT
ncbi:MAG: hypothetical protein IKO66_01970 [Paludibacteraceae bacterium]|nr:hypothetical protein [Paludibacteraceae bacterium]